MLLIEMFGPLAGPKEQEKNIDWGDDLKFYIDNTDKLIQNYLFPAIKKHQKYANHPDAYKLYITPINKCVNSYCEKFSITDPKEKFTQDVIELLARQLAAEQDHFIANGDYK